jgi:hypothetical protein
MARLAVALLIMAVAPPSFALAQEGVFVDPDSPAGKEYAIPLEQARREATGGASGREGSPGGASGQPLFGVGIERSRGAPGAQAGGSAGTGAGDGSNGDEEGDVRGQRQSGGGSPSARDLAPNARSSAAIEAAASEGSDALLTAGIAAAVLGAGLLAGFGLRRLLRGD